MKKIIVTIAIASCFWVGNTDAQAQVKTPAPSPSATLKQAVGVSEIIIDYSRPGAKGRKVFGDLVPFNEMWRTGANGSTDVSFSTDATVGGVEVKAGKYALFTIPTEKEWTVILYNDPEVSGVPGDKYDEKLEVAKFKVNSEKLPIKTETFTIDINNIKDDAADIILLWENTKVAIPVKLNTDEMVMGTITAVMNGPTPSDCYQAARYYFDNGKDLNSAYKWVIVATEANPNAFWMMRLKSQIEAGLGKYKDAIASANKSKELAEKAGNKQYVKFNEEAIKEWTGKK